MCYIIIEDYEKPICSMQKVKKGFTVEVKSNPVIGNANCSIIRKMYQ